MLDYITHLVLAHQRNGQHKRYLHREISLYIYEYPRKNRTLPEEEWSHFLLSLQNRIDLIIQGFEYRGYSFFTYMNNTLCWHVKSFCTFRKKVLYKDWIMERESALNFDSPCISEQGISLSGVISQILEARDVPGNNRRSLELRLLMLILKNIHFLDEQEYLECAEYLGYPKDLALNWKTVLTGSLADKLERRGMLIERRNHCYHRITYLEREKADIFDELRRELLNEKIRKFRSRKERINNEISRICLCPANRLIAEVLQVPKGSVDSGLFYLRELISKFKKPLTDF